MSPAAVQRLDELKTSIDTTVTYLQTVRETRWADRLKELRELVEVDPASGIEGVLAAYRGNDSFDRLYLSGPRNGHSLSERQEIEANGKLHVLKQHILALAKEIEQSAVKP